MRSPGVPGTEREVTMRAAFADLSTPLVADACLRCGVPLRADDYLTRRTADPSYTFRRHLRRTGGAIEE